MTCVRSHNRPELHGENSMKRHKLAWLLAACVASLMVSACGGSDPDYVGTGLTPGFVPGAGIAPPRFAYVAHSTSNNLSGYTVNPTTGELTSMGLTWVTGDAPVSIAVDPLVRFAYVANSGDNNISIFSIGDPSGVLTSDVAGAPVAAGNRPMSVVVDPQGRYVYVANAGDDTVSAYSRDSSGLITSVTGSPFSAGGNEPTSVVVDPSGKFVYVANFVSNTIAIFSIDTASSASNTPGALTSLGVQVTDAAPMTLAIGTVTTSGGPVSVLYVANFGTDRVSSFSINSSTGALTYLGAVASAPNTSPTSVAAEPNGKFVYSSHLQQSTLSTYKVTQAVGPTTGQLTWQPGLGATLPPSSDPYSLAADPSGKFVYTVHSQDGKVSGYKITSGTGALVAIRALPFDAEAGTSGAKFILITK